MTDAIKLVGLGKRYWQLSERAMLLKSVLPGHRPDRTERWALKGINLSVTPGETLGIVGQNGAGKTTLLRLLAGVSRPTEGRILIRGRVAPLIGVGVGFHQEMSGRENVYVNAMLLGLTRHEVAARFDEIVAFAELENHIDTPVKFYSSGMVLRLGFAIASHVDADVLLIDEILAVGDAAFQLKCFERVRELQARGTTVVLISHLMSTIRHLCPRVILMRHGRIELDGPAEEAIALHHELMSADHRAVSDRADCVVIEDRVLLGANGATHHPQQGEALIYQARLRFRARVDSPKVQFEVVSDTGTLAYRTATPISRAWSTFEAGETLNVRIPFRAHLAGGTYRLCLTVLDRQGREPFGHDATGVLMYLASQLHDEGVADLEGAIRIDGHDLGEHADVLLPAPPTITTSPQRGERADHAHD